MQTEEWEAAGLARDFGFVTDYAGGAVTRTGPDGVATVTQLDSAGRVEQVVLGAVGSGAEAVYDYDAVGEAASHTVAVMPSKRAVPTRMMVAPSSTAMG